MDRNCSLDRIDLAVVKRTGSVDQVFSISGTCDRRPAGSSDPPLRSSRSSAWEVGGRGVRARAHTMLWELVPIGFTALASPPDGRWVASGEYRGGRSRSGT